MKYCKNKKKKMADGGQLVEKRVGGDPNWAHIFPSHVAQGVATVLANASANSEQNAVLDFNAQQFSPLNYLPHTANVGVQAQYGMAEGGTFAGDEDAEFLFDDGPAAAEPEKKKKAKRDTRPAESEVEDYSMANQSVGSANNLLNFLFADGAMPAGMMPLQQGSSSVFDKIAAVESGGKYTAENPNSSAVGKYQFLWDTWGKDIQKVTGIVSKEDFKNSPQAQEQFMSWYDQNVLTPEAMKLAPVASGMSPDQIKGLIHFKGAGGAREYLTSGADRTKANNMSIPKYLGGFSKGGSIVDFLNEAGMNSSYANREKLAASLGIENYRGTAEQNLKMLAMMRSGEAPRRRTAPVLKPVEQPVQGVAPNKFLRTPQNLNDSTEANILRAGKEEKLTRAQSAKFKKQAKAVNKLESGVVVDKRTGKAIIVKGGKTVREFDVLTGENPEQNVNLASLKAVRADRSLAGTPVGGYMMTTDNSKDYDGFIRDLDPIGIFGMAAPQAKGLAIHKTAYPERDRLYGTDKPWISSGCINCKQPDITEVMKQFPQGDTLQVIDSKMPQFKNTMRQYPTGGPVPGTAAPNKFMKARETAPVASFARPGETTKLQSGVVVDKRTGQAVVVQDGKRVHEFPVLTGQNVNGNVQGKNFTELEKNPQSRVTPVGGYVMNPVGEGSSAYRKYDGNISWLNPIPMFGQAAPSAYKGEAIHQTYDPAVRDKLYNTDKSNASFGCINCRKEDYEKMRGYFPQGDTLQVIDSNMPQFRNTMQQYSEGGEYDLSPNEIAELIRLGYQIEIS